MDLDHDSNTDSNGEIRDFSYRKPTMCETYKYYSKLVKKSGKELENHNELIYSCLPQSLFEENLRLMLIDSLRLEKEVVKIFLSQNDYLINKVLGFKWFFENLSSDFSKKELFPFVSLSVRCKLITRLSKYLKSTDEAEKYFEFIRNTYGNERANYMLPRCSSEFILSYFDKTKHTFQHNNEVRILFNICRRYPELGVHILSMIFEIKKEHKYSLSSYNKILLYLSGNHVDLIVPFIKKYHSYLPSNTFGIKLTKKLSAQLKDDLFPDIMKSFLFKEKFLFSILNDEDRMKYLTGVVLVNNKNLSFHNWKNSNYKISELLNLISEKKRLMMIESVFKEAYGSEFNNHSQCWTSEILELLPATTRASFLQKLEVLLKKGEKTDLAENVDCSSFTPEYPEKLIYLYDSNTAFDKLKEILRKCPAAARRQNILTLMVKNCSINNDLKVLQQLVEFVATRHRNDDRNVISSFTNAINNHFPSSKLNSEIFEKLEELTYFSSLKHSSNDSYNCWKELHIFYRLENDIEVDVSNFFHSVVVKSNSGQSFVQNVDSKQSKTFILTVCNEITQWIRDKSSQESSDQFLKTSEMLLMSLIRTCNNFNYKNKSNRIFIRDIQGLEEIIKKKAEEKLADVGGPEWPVDVWEIMFASRFYGDIFDPHNKPIYLSYIVRRNPEFIIKYLDGILSTLLSSHLNSNKTFLNFFIVALSFLGILKKVKSKILNIFENENATFKRQAALKLYSHMCTIEEFSAAVESYVPKQKRLKKNQNGFNEIQMFIPSVIRNVKPRWKNLEFILKFCFGDFLQSALRSLSTFCHYTRFDIVIPFLKEQLNAASPKISYKKNIIRLLVELSDREGRSAFYLKCWDEYKHYSVRSILMLHVSKSFLDQPSRELFRVLEKFILESDEITIESMPHSFKIPKEFFSDYIFALWRFSEGQEKAFRDDFRRKMLWFFNRDNINLLPTEFCELIIKDSLFNSFSDNGIETFTALYLASKPEIVDRRVHFVLDLIKTRKPSSRILFDFITILIGSSNNRAADFADIFRIIHENWPEYPLGVLFEERILLVYYNLYYNVLKKSSEPDEIAMEFGKELKTLFLTTENFNDLVFIYAKVLKSFFKIFSTINAVLAVKEFLTETPNRSLAISAILSLPDQAVIWYNKNGKIFKEDIIRGKKVLDEIFSAFEGYNDKVVEIYWRSKFDFVKP